MRGKGFQSPKIIRTIHPGGHMWQEIIISLTRDSEKSKGGVVRIYEMRNHDLI
jgi:hypothetical protein